MITGNILISALCGSTLRDFTPEGVVGKMQGIRMVFSVLIPMVLGPTIGDAINAMRNIPLPNADTSADAMTTQYIPAPEIFLVASLVTLLIFVVLPLLQKSVKENKEKEKENDA